MQYWINQEGVQAGPVTREELEKMNITPNTYVWRSGLADWKKIGDVPELPICLPPMPHMLLCRLSYPMQKRQQKTQRPARFMSRKQKKTMAMHKRSKAVMWHRQSIGNSWLKEHQSAHQPIWCGLCSLLCCAVCQWVSQHWYFRSR